VLLDQVSEYLESIYPEVTRDFGHQPVRKTIVEFFPKHEQFSARISDPICPWNEGVWQFSAVEGRLVVQSAPAGATADTDLTIQGLSALIYGTHDPADFALRGWGSPAPALQTTLRQMFPAGLPYLHEYF
jgi:predicted acetyltransferase